jgi:hypothetical protein
VSGKIGGVDFQVKGTGLWAAAIATFGGLLLKSRVLHPTADVQDFLTVSFTVLAAGILFGIASNRVTIATQAKIIDAQSKELTRLAGEKGRYEQAFITARLSSERTQEALNHSGSGSGGRGKKG